MRDGHESPPSFDVHQKDPDYLFSSRWVWLKLNRKGYAGFGLCFHLPGQPILEFRFLSHSHVYIYIWSPPPPPKKKKKPQKSLRVFTVLVLSYLRKVVGSWTNSGLWRLGRAGGLSAALRRPRGAEGGGGRAGLSGGGWAGGMAGWMSCPPTAFDMVPYE